MDVVFVTGYSPKYRPAVKCAPTLAKYCDRHGYELITDSYTEENDEASWDKVKTMERVMSTYPIGVPIVWVDADCTVLDFDYDPTGLWRGDVAFSQDNNGLCCGFFMARGQVGLDLMRAALLVGKLMPAVESAYGMYKMEQNTVKHLLKSSRRWNSCYSLIPTAVVSNIECTMEVRRNSWVYHQWGTHYGSWDVAPSNG